MTTYPNQLQTRPVWDRSVRAFHWINVLCVLGLIAVGTVILNSKVLGVSTDGKILLKTIHVYIGYVFALNLAWRIVWGFIGNRFSRWRAVLPFGNQYKEHHRAFMRGLKAGKPALFIGHNPLARWMVSFLFLLLSAMAVTGLVIGGTDVYMPPFGGYFKSRLAESPATIDQIKPYSDVGVNKDARKAVREIRKPIATAHYYGFYILLAAVFLHLAAVVLTELRERSGLISAMFTGEKVFAERPVDLEG